MLTDGPLLSLKHKKTKLQCPQHLIMKAKLQNGDWAEVFLKKYGKINTVRKVRFRDRIL